jgi:hypothetical protein
MEVTFPGSDIFFVHASNNIDRVKVKITSNLFILNLSANLLPRGSDLP